MQDTDRRAKWIQRRNNNFFYGVSKVDKLSIPTGKIIVKLKETQAGKKWATVLATNGRGEYLP